MKIQDKLCSRASAIRLNDLGLFQPKVEEDWKAGDWYSVIMGDGREMLFSLGNQEDPPYKMYQPVRLYDCAELLAMIDTTITINNLQVPKAAESLADHLIGMLERQEITPDKCNEILLVD